MLFLCTSRVSTIYKSLLLCSSGSPTKNTSAKKKIIEAPSVFISFMHRNLLHGSACRHAVGSIQLRTRTNNISVAQVSRNCLRVNAKRTCIAIVTWWDMTDWHFAGYHITGIRILITGHSFRTGITRTHAPCSRITDLITGAEQPVVRTGKIIRRVHTDIVDLVTGLHGTVYTIITIDWYTWLAVASSGITGFLTVAEESIIAVRVIRAP